MCEYYCQGVSRGLRAINSFFTGQGARPLSCHARKYSFISKSFIVAKILHKPASNSPLSCGSSDHTFATVLHYLRNLDV
jgi:hypothetical protein